MVAEDFAQEALLKILDGLDTFRGGSRFTTWAHAVAVPSPGKSAAMNASVN